MPQRFSHLTVRVSSVGELFGAFSTFELPWFQRSYAWDEEHVDRLVAEVEAAALDTARNRYFLGHVCLAGADGGTVRIIDGQQRILTLTMLYALLRDLAPEGADISELDSLVWSTADDGTRTPKVLAQDCVREFLQQAVLEAGATGRRIDPFRAELTDTECRFLANRNRMASLVSPMRDDPARWQRFTRFLVDRCYVVVETVDSEEEAWDMLAKEEERRAAHHASEQAKATMIGVMPRGEQQEAGRIWDDIHGRLGADNVARLLCHLRTMRLKRRSSRPIIVELSEGFALHEQGLSFMRQTLEPHARWFEAIRDHKLAEGATGEALAHRLSLLDLVEHDLWMAPLMKWLSLRQGDERETLAFVAALDRMTMMLRIAAVDPIVRERRFVALSAEIAPDAKVAGLRRLVIEPELGRVCADNLRSRTLQSKRYAPYVLRRLSRLLGDAAAPPPEATIEHVLPRNPRGDSPWRKTFPSDKVIDDHANRLGNLALLAFADNQRAGNRPWPDKRSILAGSGYALARDAASASDWTRRTIMDRTERLASLLLAD
ncbi:MAG: DUF262 domain-containing HNH endonuclease family protein [Hyphomicrobiaceae bacterium]